jgi:alpha-beta hydrolase superfamily lysophospholipase
VKGDPHELSLRPTVHPRRPGLRLWRAEPRCGFTDTFTSRYIDTGGLRQHAVIGGDGPPLLLVHGWPETWYAWRLLMPTLARDFEVIAVDQRGIGLTDSPRTGTTPAPWPATWSR